jgi:enoyl-CoA hydratase
VVCAINGDAIGAGLELALACDVRIAADGATLSVPEVSLGLLPLAGGTQRLPRLIGRGKALEMILTGEPIDTQEALRVGLVSAVVPRERLLAEAEAIASRIAERGPLAVRYAKEAIARGLEMPLEQALRFETDLTIILQTTEDRAEGVRAFLEKRKAEFKGM